MSWNSIGADVGAKRSTRAFSTSTSNDVIDTQRITRSYRTNGAYRNTVRRMTPQKYSLRRGLVVELQSKLQLPGYVIPNTAGRNLAEIRSAESCATWNSENNAVKNIECFSAELEIPTFSEPHVELPE